jgi:PleD family two-component response regulator
MNIQAEQSGTGHAVHPSPSGRANLRFLIVDDHADGRYLLSKTLLRKFRDAVVLECQSSEAAFSTLKAEPLDAVISHRTFDFDPFSLVAALRKINPTVPLVMMSGIDRSKGAAEVGATTFLHYDQWLLLGSVVANLLEKSPEKS